MGISRMFIEEEKDDHGGIYLYKKNRPETKGKVWGQYNDRLYQEDWDKNDKLCKKHFGTAAQNWDGREPKKVESFLSDWFKRPVELVAIVRYPNGSGHFNWRFDYINIS